MKEDLSLPQQAALSPPIAEPLSIPTVRPTFRARALLRAMRPKQWLKNVLVFAAPGAGGVLTGGHVLAETAGAFVVFCMVSSAMYLVNDVLDAPSDRRHPTKQHRPIASGELGERVALAAAAILLVAGVAAGIALGGEFLAAVGAYITCVLAYSLWCKETAVIDVALVAAGFVIRAVAGSVAVDVPLSQWFLILTSFLSIFVVAGKRYGDHLAMADAPQSARGVAYTTSYLRYLWMTASAVAITAYCLWAFAQPHVHHHVPWSELSTIPFVLAILRYALLLEAGQAGAPEDVLLGDRTLQVLAVSWAVLYGCGVYLGR